MTNEGLTFKIYKQLIQLQHQKDRKPDFEMDRNNSKRHMYPNVHCNTIYNAQDMEAT